MKTAICLCILLAVPAFAHHSFWAEFDESHPIHVEGEVLSLDWTNPHASVTLAGKDEDGKTVEWTIQMSTPKTLIENGWTATTLRSGTRIRVDGYRAKNAASKVVGSTEVTLLATGQKLKTPTIWMGPLKHQRSPNGFAVLPSMSIQTLFVCRYS